MKIVVAGVGYVGLVTAVTLADVGHDVICLDVDKGKLKMLKEGISPIYEYGLEELMLKNRERLEFTDDVTKYSEAQVIIIGVGTPEKEDGSADLSAVFSVVDSIADNCSDGTVVVVKSTVPIGTCESVRRRIDERRLDLHFFVVSNPEFLSQGTAVRDTFNADRIVIGADDEQAYKTVEEMYAPLELPIVHVSVRSSEMIKYASNDFLALKISYINEIANFCEMVGASCAVITKAVEEPTYTLSMTFIVNNKSEKDLSSSGENSVSYNDMSASAYMANTFVHLMTGRTMCNAIAAECKSYPKTADQVAKMIAVSRKTDSSIIDMTVTASSPEEAYELAQAVKDTYKDVVRVYSGGSIHLCDEPELPTKPDKSVGTVRNAIIGALAGAVICALIIIIRDSARNTVRSQEDIQNKLQLNVIGEVSQVPSGERFYKKSAHGDRELLITDKACGFAFVETYKAMRTKLELLNGRRGYKSFVVSSTGANEGKTTVAVNLSLALAQNGYSVLLVDADLRKPSVLKNLGISNLSGNGIADVVNGAKNSSDAIKYIEKYKMFVLAGDESITDPTEMLSNAKTGEFIAAAREKFDYIIIDTPPIGIVADAAICAKYTDSSIFVIREDVFPVPAILEAVSDLTQGGTDLAGCVYNISTDRSKGGYGNYSISSRGYGYGYGYGKHYGYGYGYGSHSGSHGKNSK